MRTPVDRIYRETHNEVQEWVIGFPVGVTVVNWWWTRQRYGTEVKRENASR